MKERVLITGIEGFTGRHLSRYLSGKGYDVYGTARKPSGMNERAVYAADLARAEDWLPVFEQARPDYIIHLAGVSFAASDDLKSYYQANTVGTHYVLDAALRSGLNFKKIVVASSAAVYGAQEGAIAEDAPLMPRSHYGISKLATEYVARTFFGRLPILIVRPFNYTGSGQPDHFVIPKIIKHFKARSSYIELGNIDIEREFNGILFICDIYERLLQSDTAIHDIVNLCSGRGFTLREVIQTAEDIFNHEMDVRINPNFIRAGDPKRLVGCPERLTLITGQLCESSLRKTLLS